MDSFNVSNRNEFRNYGLKPTYEVMNKGKALSLFKIDTRQYPFLLYRVLFYDRNYNEHTKEGTSDAEKYERGIRLYRITFA